MGNIHRTKSEEGRRMRLFSTEQVSKWHPDKMADQVSDSILTECLKLDKSAHVACETLLKGSTCVLAGEITTTANVDFAEIAKKKLKELEPWKDYKVIQLITKQSPQINAAVAQEANIGAGDQGMMFGYATAETDSLLPYGFALANEVIARLEKFTRENPNVLKGDAKTQVTVDLDKEGAESVKLILISVCYWPEWQLGVIRSKIRDLFPEYSEEQLLINPSGEWTIGGPDADAGLTGRKIVADQYGGYYPVGGGAFSGKDPTKVDRSASYMARKIACDLVHDFDLLEASVQLAYAIGRAYPVSAIATGKTQAGEEQDFSRYVAFNYDLTPRGIIKALDLLNKDYAKLAEGCHYRNN